MQTMSFELDAMVGKYGDSIVIRIPPKAAISLGIVPGDRVRLKLQRMKLVPVGEELESGRARKKTRDLFISKIRQVGAPVRAS